MGVQYLCWNYGQKGIVATVYLAEECENTTAWQRFTPGGPVALLPLDGQRSSLVWSQPDAQAKELLQMSDEQFVDALNEAYWNQYPRSSLVDSAVSSLGRALQSAGLASGAARQLPPSARAVAPRSRAAFPLGFGHAANYVAEGVALVGDAAHRVHPLAGQGVNLGFGDVSQLVSLLADSIYRGESLDSTIHWLKEYETLRQRRNVPTQLAIEGLHRLYGADLPAAVLLRSLGLQLTHALAPVKKAIMSHATS